MSRVSTLTRKGQITIPKEVREALGLRPFDKVEIVLEDGEAKLRKARRSLAEIAGSLPKLGIPVEEMTAIAKAERAKRIAEEGA